MLFNNQFDSKIIADGKKFDVWTNDVERRRNVLKAIDFYHNKMKYYLENKLETIYPTTHDKIGRYSETYPLTERVINDISILFQDPMALDIDKESLKDDFNDLIIYSKLQPVLNKINHLVNLTYKVGVMPVYRDNNVELDIITADKCFVYQDLINPTKITDLFVHINPLEQSPSEGLKHRVDSYIRWTDKTQSIVKVDVTNGEIVSESEPTENPYNQIPIVWFANDINTDTFWPEKINALISTNEWINIDQTNLNLMYSFQAYSTLVLTGMDDKTLKNIVWGPQAVLALPLDNMATVSPTAGYINPSPKIQEYEKSIADKKADAAVSNGLSAQAYKKDNTNVNSGYQLKLMNEGLLKKLKLDKLLYLPSIRELLKLMMKVWSYNNNTRTFPEDTVITLNFAEITYDSNPLEEAQLNQIKLAQGLTSPIKILKDEDPDLTDELAIELYKKLAEERNMLSVNTLDSMQRILTGTQANQEQI